MPEYIYGVIEPGAGAPSASGIADAPLRVIGSDGAAALVSELQAGELVLGRDEMLIHARVLESALGQGTVLPMRFGVVMEPDEVRDRLLGSHAAHLREQLRALAGKVEFNVRVLYEEEQLMREIIGSDPQIAQLRRAIHGLPEDATYPQRIELGERVAAAVERAREADAERLLAQLRPVSDDVVVSPAAHERIALSASFLVARARTGPFDQTLDRLAAQSAGRLRFKSAGPLPPHSFVDLGEAG